MAIWDFINRKIKPAFNDNDRQMLALVRGIGINTPGKLFETLFPNENSGDIQATQSTSLTLSAVYRAINLSADSLNLPLNVYSQKNGQRQIVDERSRWWPAQFVLAYSPSKMHTPAEWIRLMEYSRLIFGNAFSRVIVSPGGQILALEWLHPNRVQLSVVENQIVYDVYGLDGNFQATVPYWRMIHVKALSTDGITGKSPIDFAAESLGFGLATQKAGNSFFKDGMRAAVVATHPGVLSDNARDKLEKALNKKMTGVNKTGRITVLEEGIKLETISITPEQAEFLASRRFTVDEVARWFGLPPHLLANLEKSSFNNIEHQSLEFIRDSVRPRARIYEQELNWKLLNNNREVFTSFNLNALMRADAASRAEFYFKMRQMKALSANEVRAFEDMNPYPGGDVYENPSIQTNESITKGQPD